MTAIDTSYWQHFPDFAQVRNSGVSRVIMKCGGGEGGRIYQDSVYAINRGNARRVGLAVGSYFFNGPVDPVSAADFQMSIVDWKFGDTVALDVENNFNERHWNPSQVLAWAQRILAHGVPAKSVLIYMSSSITSEGWDAIVALGVRLWVAQYGPNDGNAHSGPSTGPWREYALWQFTSARGCPGIVGNVDTNQISASWESETLTPIQSISRKKVKDMQAIRSADGAISLIGELTVSPETQAGWVEDELIWGPYVQLTNQQYQDQIGAVANRRAQLGIAATPVASIDPAALSSAVKAAFAANPVVATVDVSSVINAVAAESTTLAGIVAAIAALPSQEAAAVLAALKSKL